MLINQSFHDYGATEIIILSVTFVAGVLAVAYVFAVWIIPTIMRYKNRTLVEESDGKNEDPMPIPPSSDRNQMEVAETDEQLSWLELIELTILLFWYGWVDKNDKSIIIEI